MSEFVHAPTKTFTAGAALKAFRRVLLDSNNKLAYAGAEDAEIGTLEEEAFADGDLRAVRLRSAEGTAKFEAAAAITKGARVYGESSGRIDDAQNGNFIGVALNAAAASGDIVEVLRAPDISGRMFANTAASGAVTNTAVETDFDQSYTVPANTLKVGDTIRVFAQVIAPNTNATDTLNIKLKLGGTVIAASGAVDVANNDIAYIEAVVIVRTVGAGGTMVAAGIVGIGVEGTVTAKPFKMASSALDTTGALKVAVSATWSVANAGDSCRLDVLTVERIAR